MSRGQHAADDGSFNKSAGGAMMRGIALIAVAVVLGIVLLNATDASTPASVSVGTGDTTGTTVGPDDGSTAVTEPTQPIAHDPATVKVLVANGSGVKGAASKVAEVLKASNFVTATPVNTTTAASVSAVYFGPGFQEDAKAVAALLKPSPTVSPLPSALPVGNLDNAVVLVVVAADLAAPASTPGSTSSGSQRTTTTAAGPPTG